MLLFSLLAVTAAAQAPQPSIRPEIRQATATVRIVAGEEISATRLPSDALVRQAEVKGADGDLQTVRLVEFP